MEAPPLDTTVKVVRLPVHTVVLTGWVKIVAYNWQLLPQMAL
ncbi:MAG: hypothetical protein WDM90_08965 [Ferruginibacter sp.]